MRSISPILINRMKTDGMRVAGSEAEAKWQRVFYRKYYATAFLGAAKIMCSLLNETK